MNVSLVGQIPIIGVGGIETAEDVFERIKAGASLVQSKLAFPFVQRV